MARVRRGSAAICPSCYMAMNRLYYKDASKGKLKWIRAGWFCPKCGTYTDLEGYRLIRRTPEALRELCRQ